MTATLASAPLLSAHAAAATEPGSLGGKAANLARLMPFGFAVPEWSPLPTEVFVSTLEGAGTALAHLTTRRAHEDGMPLVSALMAEDSSARSYSHLRFERVHEYALFRRAIG